MDFLTLMMVYVVLFGAVVICYYYGDSAFMNSGLASWIRRSISKAFYWIIPPYMTEKTSLLIDYTFYRRNHVLQVAYGGLVFAGHTVFLLDMLPIFYVLSADQNHVLIPLVILVINTLMFHWTCTSDPGEITLSSQKHYSPVYPYDGILYENGSKCRTCSIVKIPRSKHCSVCDRCVYRFDHHCIWTNNCIGGLNHGYFILFLLSISVMCVNGVLVCCSCMQLVIGHFKMLESSYLDETGTLQPVTLLVLAQHLFLKFPRIVFMLVSLIFLILAVGGFFGYHVFLVITNQTTNERYKMDYLRHSRDKSHNSPNGRYGLRSKFGRPRNFYDKGLFANLYEIALPKSFVKSKWKKLK